MDRAKTMKIKTYIKEVIVFLIVIIITGLFSKIDVKWLLTSVALLFTFCHMQISSRLAEAKIDGREVYCYRLQTFYLIAKEISWVSLFIISELYLAIVGPIIFLLYPAWRGFYVSRKRKKDEI